MRGPPPDQARSGAVPDAPHGAGKHIVADEEIIAGDVNAVTEAIAAQCAAAGAGHLLAYNPNILSRDETAVSNALWEQVNQRLRAHGH